MNNNVQIEKVRELGLKNRSQLPRIKDFNVEGQDFVTIFDVSVTHFNLEDVGDIMRKIISKITMLSWFIATEGRVGPAQVLITSVDTNNILKKYSVYNIIQLSNSIISDNIICSGIIGDIKIYIDLDQKDSTMYMGRIDSINEALTNKDGFFYKQFCAIKIEDNKGLLKQLI